MMILLRSMLLFGATLFVHVTAYVESKHELSSSIVADSSAPSNEESQISFGEEGSQQRPNMQHVFQKDTKSVSSVKTALRSDTKSHKNRSSMSTTDAVATKDSPVRRPVANVARIPDSVDICEDLINFLRLRDWVNLSAVLPGVVESEWCATKATENGQADAQSIVLSELLVNLNEARDDGGYPLIHQAIREGDMDALSQFIESGLSLDVVDSAARTPLLYALAKRQQDAAIRLLQALKYLPSDIRRAIMTMPDSHGNTLLHEATHRDADDLLRILLEEMRAAHQLPSILNEKNEKGMTCLHHAVLHGNSHAVTLLVSEPGIEYDAVDLDGESPLRIAVQRGDVKTASKLLELHGERLRQQRGLVKDSEDGSEEAWEDYHEQERSPRTLDEEWTGNGNMQKGFDTPQTSHSTAEDSSPSEGNQASESLQMVAAKKGDLKMMDLLLAAGEDANSLRPGEFNQMMYLLWAPACDVATCKTDHPVLCALWSLSKSVDDLPMRLLLSLCPASELNRWGSKGATLLHAAASTGRLELVQLLLDRGASLEALPRAQRALVEKVLARGAKEQNSSASLRRGGEEPQALDEDTEFILTRPTKRYAENASASSPHRLSSGSHFGLKKRNSSKMRYP